MVFSVFAGTVAISGSAAAQVANAEGEPLNSGSTYYAGQDVAVDVSNLAANEEYRVREVNDDNEPATLRRTPTVSGGSFDFELDGDLSEGDFVIVNESGFVVPVDDGTATTPQNSDSSNTTAADFEVVTQDLTAEFEDASVGNDGGDTTVEYEITSDVRNDYVVNISADGLDAEDLVSIFEDDATVEIVDEDDDIVQINQTGESTAEGTYQLDFNDINSDTYSFEANVTDAEASDVDDIEVTDTGDASADFGDNVYQDQRGDVVNITIEMSNDDEATLQVGNVDENGYTIIADVTDDDEDGVAYVEFNSFTAGNTSATTLTAGDDDTELNNIRNDSANDSYNGNRVPTGSDILDAGDYDMFVQAGTPGGNITDSSDARATLSLNEASVDNLQTWTAPSDSDLFSADVEDIPAYAQAGNLTQSDVVAEGDTLVVQVDASGLEGALENGDATELYNASSASGQIFNLTFEGDDVPNSPDESANIADLSTDEYSVLYDGANDAHYVVIESSALVNAGDLTYEDGDTYTANFTVYDSDSDLVDDDVSVTQDFDVEDPEAELDTNADDEIVLQAATGQEVTGETNLAPGTEMELSLDSDASGDPFVVRPEATVQQDGTFTGVADLSENDAGSEFTASITDPSDLGDDYDGRLVEATVTPGTETPDDSTGTETADDTTPEDTATETADDSTPMDTEEPATTAGGEATETATGGSGPGFTAALALIALVAAALLAVRRNN